MDIGRLKTAVLEYWKRNWYTAIILLVGLFLMCSPTDKQEDSGTPQIQAPIDAPLQDSLEDILSFIHGAGNVKVLLTQDEGEKILYQTDRTSSADTLRSETVLVTNTEREEVGLISQVLPPTYRGAVILCQGADHAEVRLAVVEAVMRATGLTSDRITVLKMK